MKTNLDFLFPSFINKDVYSDLWSQSSNIINSDLKYYCNYCACLDPIEESDLVKCSKCHFHYHINCAKTSKSFNIFVDFVCCDKESNESECKVNFKNDNKVDSFEGLAYEEFNEVESVSSCFLKKKRNKNDILNLYPDADFYISLEENLEDNLEEETTEDTNKNPTSSSFNMINTFLCCEICLIGINIFENNFKCKACNCLAHYKCLDKLNIKTQDGVCLSCISSTSNKSNCCVCFNKNGLLLKSNNSYWIHAICLYSSSELLYFSENRFNINMKLANKNPKCKICNKNAGYTHNSQHPYCSYIAGKNYKFYYNSEIINRREEYLVTTTSLIPDKVLLENLKLTFSYNLKRLSSIANKKKNHQKLKNRVNDISLKSNNSKIPKVKSSTITLPKLSIDNNETFHSLIKSANLKEIEAEITEKSNSIDKNKYSIWNIEPLNNFLIGISKIKVNCLNEINDNFNFSSSQKLSIMKSNLEKTTKNNISIFNKISNRIAKSINPKTKTLSLNIHKINQKYKKTSFEKIRRRLKNGLEICSMNDIIDKKIDICPDYLASLSQEEKIKQFVVYEQNCTVCLTEFLEGEVVVSCNGCKLTFHKECYFLKENYFVEGLFYCDLCLFEKVLIDFPYLKRTTIITDKIYSEIHKSAKVCKTDDNFTISNKIKSFCRGGIKCIMCNNSTGALKYFLIKDKIIWIHMMCLLVSNNVKVKDYNKSLKADNLYISDNQKLENYMNNLSNPPVNTKACMLCMKKEGEIFFNKDNNAHFFCSFLNGFEFKLENTRTLISNLIICNFEATFYTTNSFLMLIQKSNNLSILRRLLYLVKEELVYDKIFDKEYANGNHPNQLKLFTSDSSTKNIIQIEVYKDKSVDLKGREKNNKDSSDKMDYLFFKKCCWICFSEVIENEESFIKCSHCEEKAHSVSFNYYKFLVLH